MPPFAIHIYGDGTYATEVITLAAEYPENIFYYGRQSLETINHKLRTTHYSLMPSLFLETFGLTALESLRQ
ncbi:MAG: glycosyltransferase [Candidatus Peribacteria bacterium]|nr:MAG: glycosyltransferase [Candidatus Peribacteria bacterium]